ncbi:unnamed protein product [Prorocentrum cordatum]|uniref:Holocytochrome c-type synthase n=1 Tax=Prorocentrum cordatum TaxID=2364126 RepID=A0ABN9XSM4_9DINO|nr:unnamed protein product [Polarella glacialis]
MAGTLVRRAVRTVMGTLVVEMAGTVVGAGAAGTLCIMQVIAKTGWRVSTAGIRPAPREWAPPPRSRLPAGADLLAVLEPADDWSDCAQTSLRPATADAPAIGPAAALALRPQGAGLLPDRQDGLVPIKPPQPTLRAVDPGWPPPPPASASASAFASAAPPRPPRATPATRLGAAAGPQLTPGQAAAQEAAAGGAESDNLALEGAAPMRGPAPEPADARSYGADDPNAMFRIANDPARGFTCALNATRALVQPQAGRVQEWTAQMRALDHGCAKAAWAMAAGTVTPKTGAGFAEPLMWDGHDVTEGRPAPIACRFLSALKGQGGGGAPLAQGASDPDEWRYDVDKYPDMHRLPGGKQPERDYKMGPYAHKMQKDPATGKLTPVGVFFVSPRKDPIP